MKVGTIMKIGGWLRNKAPLLLRYLLFGIGAFAGTFAANYYIDVEHKRDSVKLEWVEMNFDACEEQLGAWGHEYIQP